MTVGTRITLVQPIGSRTITAGRDLHSAPEDIKILSLYLFYDYFQNICFHYHFVSNITTFIVKYMSTFKTRKVIMKVKQFAALIILDGFGIAEASDSNAIHLANKPFIDKLFNDYPHNTLEASGEAVGLPDGQMGNSEVGHLNLGAGRVVYQSLTRVNVAIKDKSFFEIDAFKNAIEHVKKNNSKLHILGLVSDGGVHSHTTHFKALYDLAKSSGIEDKTYLHAFLDGRDTPPTSGKGYLETLVNYGMKVATVSGRYYAMDRDSNWDRLQKAYDNMVLGTGELISSPINGIQKSYDNNITDEFVVPFLVDKKGLISDSDAVIFANFRPDRAIRISTAISNLDAVKDYYMDGKATFSAKPLNNILYVSMMKYASSIKGLVAFPLQTLDNLYGDVISSQGLNQLRIAETEKYAHVTFFFDGGVDKELPNSDRILIPSPKVATYDLQPEMSAYEVAEKAVESITSKKYDTMILNFANPDMVGHTGVLEAAVKAIETVDKCLEKVIDAINSIGGIAIIIADHGNAEKMRDTDGSPHTAHTTNLVPVLITKKGINVNSGSLQDIAPTLLEILGVNKPAEMTGHSLINKI